MSRQVEESSGLPAAQYWIEKNSVAVRRDAGSNEGKGTRHTAMRWMKSRKKQLKRIKVGGTRFKRERERE
jgi:hypothetical protein